ncbi:hypothetical protein GCM10028857_04460 [Salinarchaeum chitinilyticum]
MRRSAGKRGRQLLLVGCVLAIVLASVPGAVAVVTSNANPASTPAVASDPCAAVTEEPAVVVTPPADDPTGPGSTAAVYNGSALVVHLCQPAGGSRTLDADGLEWATVLETDQDRLRIRVVGPTNDSLGSLAAPEPVPGPSLAIVDHAVSTQLTEKPIPVSSAERATELRTALEAYRTAEATLQSRLAALANATARVENGSTPTSTPIEETVAARAQYRSATEQLRTELYEVADSAVGGPRSAAAIRQLETRSGTMENRTASRLEAHDAALRDRQQSLTWSLRLRIVGLGLLGVVLGATIGAILPTRRGRAARRRVAAGEWTSYSRRAVLVPVAVGLVLLCLGLGWLLLTAGDAIAEVMLP